MQKVKSPTLISVFLLKEGIFWRRTLGARKTTGILGLFILIPLLAIAHYAFALMHISFECFLWATNREQFRNNLSKLQIKGV